MDQVPPPPVPTQLIVFADDWGRHPSSSQHLIRELLPHYPTLWVNTVGTRRPKLRLADLSRGAKVVTSWLGRSDRRDGEVEHANLQVVSPPMYPGYRSQWQQQLNDRSITHSVKKSLLPDHRHVVITTLPTTAELPDSLKADRWVYYCVDDYSQWPGTDHAVMDAMERELVRRVDAVACVSQTLQQRVASICQPCSTMLTHGVDLQMWHNPLTTTQLAPAWPEIDKPVALFWGLLDERLDREWAVALSRCESLHAVFAGPLKIDQGQLFNADSIYLGPLAFKDLPAHAAASSVLVMPYIDAPVTQAMQPLKLLEYLATHKPVVVRDLPSTRPWADCCDRALSAGGFIELVKARSQTGILPEQLKARQRRLQTESWTAKAAQLAEIINAD
jgi:glycosyltransferase involved in cell wall biosynthesis